MQSRETEHPMIRSVAISNEAISVKTESEIVLYRLTIIFFIMEERREEMMLDVEMHQMLPGFVYKLSIPTSYRFKNEVTVAYRNREARHAWKMVANRLKNENVLHKDVVGLITVML